MVPPVDIFGIMPSWVGVYLAVLLTSIAGSIVLYRRVFKLIRQGKHTPRFDRPLVRLSGAISIVLGQRKVLQRVGSIDPKSHRIDLAGLGHACIFWGFLSFSLSYVIFIFGGVIWYSLPTFLLTETGVKIFSIYLDVLALLVICALLWALMRRWIAKPHRLSFALTRKGESIVIVGLTSSLMIATLLVHAFHVSSGGAGPESEDSVSGALSRLFSNFGITQSTAHTLQTISWWIHLAIILGFGLYVPFSKHIHMVAAPLNAYFRSLEPRGTLPTIDLENTERFGAGRIQDFTWKAL